MVARFFRVLIFLVAVVVVIGPWPIPEAAPLESARGKEALARVEAAGAAAAAEARGSGPLFAGFGRREIEAPVGSRTGPHYAEVPEDRGGTNLAGYGNRA